MSGGVPIPPHVSQHAPPGQAQHQHHPSQQNIPPAAVAGMVQASTQVAQSAIDAFRGSPLLLAIILLNCLFVSVITWSFNEAQDRRHQEQQLILGRCLPSVGR